MTIPSPLCLVRLAGGGGSVEVVGIGVSGGHHHQEVVVVLNHLDALARSPRALAAVLEAAGASAVARIGALLARRTS